MKQPVGAAEELGAGELGKSVGSNVGSGVVTEIEGPSVSTNSGTASEGDEEDEGSHSGSSIQGTAT